MSLGLGRSLAVVGEPKGGGVGGVRHCSSRAGGSGFGAKQDVWARPGCVSIRCLAIGRHTGNSTTSGSVCSGSWFLNSLVQHETANEMLKSTVGIRRC